MNVTIGSIDSIEQGTFGGSSTLKEVRIYNVTTIYSNAFYNYKSLEYVELNSRSPEFSIGNSAFSGCISLATIILPSFIRSIEYSAFYSCSNLTRITIPESIKSIANGCFYGCTSLEEVSILSDSISFGESSFYGCGLRSLEIKSSAVTWIGSNCFSNCRNLETFTIMNSSGTVTIYNNVFSDSSIRRIIINCSVNFQYTNQFNGCNNLTYIFIGGTAIGYTNAFYSASKLENITLCSINSISSNTLSCKSTLKEVRLFNVSEIRENSFSGFISLEYIEFLSTLSINNKAFYGCVLLTNINLPNSLQTIGDYAFSGCTSLNIMKFPDSINSIGNFAFEKCNITSIRITSNIRNLGRYAFNLCSNLTFVELLAEINTLPEGIFSNCSLISNIKLPETISVISSYCFDGCKSLKDIIILSDVVEFGKYSFRGCGFSSLEINSTIVNSIGSNCFADCPNLVSITVKGRVTFASESFQKIGNLRNIRLGSTDMIQSNSFQNCQKLETFEIINDSGTVTIYSNAFSYSSINQIIINCNVSFVQYSSNIDSYPFSNCNNLTYIFIGGSVTFSGSNSNGLYSIRKLENITIIGRIDAISSNTLSCKSTLKEVRLFNVGSILDKSFYQFINLEYLEIRSSSQSFTIKNYAFYECTSMKYVYLPESTQNTGEYLFSGCISLSKMDIPNQLRSINSYMFENCKSIKSINIPESVTTIGNFAFSNCNNLTNIIIQSNTIELNSFCFNNCQLINNFAFNGSSIRFNNNCFNGASGIEYVNIECDMVYLNRNCFSESFVKYITLKGNVYMENNVLSKYIHAIFIDGNIMQIYPESLSGSKSLSNFTITQSISYDYRNMYISFSECSNLSYVSFSSSIQTIPNNCFAECIKLSSFKIPESVRYIGSYAFSGCITLTSINIPNNVTNLGSYIFKSCISLTDVTFQNNNFRLIPEGCFESCTSMTIFTFPSSIETIGIRSFYNCNQLSSIQGYTSLSLIGDSAFFNCSFSTLEIIGTNLNINQYAFKLCGEVTSIKITGSLNSISEKSFSDLSKLVFVNFSCTISQFPANVFYNSPNIEQVIFYSVKILGENCFSQFNKLKLIDIKDVKEIQQRSFYQCSNLESISFPSSLTIIGPYSFYECNKLTELHFNGISSVGDHAFHSCTGLINVEILGTLNEIPEYLFYNCQKLCNITFGETNDIKEIGPYAFMNCYQLDINLLSLYNIEKIGERAFYGCSKITRLDLSPLLTEIGSYAFYQCSNVQTVRIPSRVTKVGAYAFCYCSKLKSMTLSIFMNSIESMTFANTALSHVIIYPGILVKPDAFYNCRSITKLELCEDVVVCKNAFRFNNLNLYLANNVQILYNSLQGSVSNIYFYGTKDYCSDQMVKELNRIYNSRTIFVTSNYTKQKFANLDVNGSGAEITEIVNGRVPCSCPLLYENLRTLQKIRRH